MPRSGYGSTGITLPDRFAATNLIPGPNTPVPFREDRHPTGVVLPGAVRP